MKKQIIRNIKDLITEYPAVKTVLDEFQIGCVACNVGTCKLGDIVEIHQLSQDQELRLIQNLGRIIYPSGQFEMPALKDRSAEKSREVKFSPPMRELVEEHGLIKRLVALIPSITRYLKSLQTADAELVAHCTDFITQYADKFHHAKEEDVLFGYFDISQDIIQAMYEDHKEGRALVQSIKSTMADGGSACRIADFLTAYGKLINAHIDKEDHILYPWMDRQLSTGQVGELYAKFRLTNERFDGVNRKYEQLINKLEMQFKEA